MNTKRLIMNSLAGLLIAGGSFAAKAEEPKSVYEPKPGVMTEQGYDSGDNYLKEPKYVTYHMWEEVQDPSKYQVVFRIERNIENDTSKTKIGNPVEHKLKGDKTPEYFVAFDESNKPYNPLLDEQGLVEYIKSDSEAIGLLVLAEGNFYRIYTSEGYSTFSKEKLDKDLSLLNSEQRKLYDLMQLKSSEKLAPVESLERKIIKLTDKTSNKH
jgi:hypothetical protein